MKSAVQDELKVKIQNAVIREIKNLRYTPTLERQINTLKDMLRTLDPKQRDLYIAAVSLIGDWEAELGV